MKNIDHESIILAGDIGGTKTNLGLFIQGKRRPLLKVIETYPSQGALKLEDIIEQFLERHPVSITSACFGIAGPVINGRCRTTNLPWDVSEVRIKGLFRWKKIRLINDLTATALGIPLLNSRELVSLNRIRPRKGQNLGLIAPGTGLGQALLIFQDGRYIPVSSEGGHADFSPNSEAELKLWRYLHNRYGHVSMERLLSGPGLVNIYSWLKDSGQYREPKWLNIVMKEGDPARLISEQAMNNKQPLCTATLNVFVSIFGSVAGNPALTGAATGGVYLGGGIPPKILSKLKEDIFMNAFTNKGRFKDFMKKISVRVILNDRATLLGSAYSAFEL